MNLSNIELKPDEVTPFFKLKDGYFDTQVLIRDNLLLAACFAVACMHLY